MARKNHRSEQTATRTRYQTLRHRRERQLPAVRRNVTQTQDTDEGTSEEVEGKLETTLVFDRDLSQNGYGP